MRPTPEEDSGITIGAGRFSLEESGGEADPPRVT